MRLLFYITLLSFFQSCCSSKISINDLGVPYNANKIVVTSLTSNFQNQLITTLRKHNFIIQRNKNDKLIAVSSLINGSTIKFIINIRGKEFQIKILKLNNSKWIRIYNCGSDGSAYDLAVIVISELKTQSVLYKRRKRLFCWCKDSCVEARLSTSHTLPGSANLMLQGTSVSLAFISYTCDSV